MKFCCIGDEDTARGFRLAGVRSWAAGTAREAEQALELACGDDFGVIIMTSAAAGLARGRVEAIRLERQRPLIVELDGPPHTAGPEVK
jgi:vacuolar-type H+-ATPase subunit F/Vma7